MTAPATLDPDARRVGPYLPTPKRVLERRLLFVTIAWQRGNSTAQIRQTVTMAAREEKAQWEAYRRDPANVKEPLLIWGETTPGDRTIDNYIARVVALHEVEGSELKTKTNQFIGKQLARLEAGYAAAMQAGDGELALKYLREIANFLGLNAVPKLQVGGIEGGEPIKTQEVAMATHTEEGVHSILGELAARAQARLDERKRAEAGA